MNEIKAARILALSYHIKILNHFALIRAIRREILSLKIINQIFSILDDQSLIDSRGRMDEAKSDVVIQCLTLLYNLAVEKEVPSMLKTKNIFNICLKLRPVKNKTVCFMSQILLTMLDKNADTNICDPASLSKISIEYISKSIYVPRLIYQGVKLHQLLKQIKSKSNRTYCENKIAIF